MPTASPLILAQGLRRMTWGEVIERAWITLLCLMLIKLVAPAVLRPLVQRLILAAPLLTLAAKDLSHLPDALARTRAARARRDWPAVALAWLPPELVGLLRLGQAQRRGFVNWLLRRAQPALPEGQALGYLERGAYRTAVAIVLFSAFFEIPLDALILPFFIHDAGTMRMIHAAMLAGALSTLVWLLGDRALVGRGCHVLGETQLELRIGARTHGLIPLDCIQAWERVDGPVDAWCKRRGVARADVLLASPLDKPNAVLILKNDCPVRLTHLGRERTGLSCVFLYLDRPDALASALGEARPIRPA